MAKKGKGSGGSIDFKVTASGLNKVDKDAKKAGQSFNTLDKNSRSTDRAMKGVSNMSSNTTKNFSKMSQGITGGLVPAYATLAAQLFALDALFRFFREAADFRVLQQGQELFAASTGRAMRTLSKDIQAATSAQITFKEASQATAIGLSAGLSPSMLKELGQAARTVSVALGRDTTDSFNRLIRGVTKAEPELLDELGIILRLEEATTRYAASLGLNKNQLTTFQKSQAVANEVLRQSEERYGAIAEMIGDDSVNQLNKLMVAFDEVLNHIRLAIAPLAEFFGTFLTENIESATAAIGIFAASITGGLIRGAMPTINYGAAGKQAAQVAGAGDLQKTALMNKDRIKRLSTPGEATKADIAAYERAVNAKESKMIKFEKRTRAEHQRTVRILKAQRQRMIADAATGFDRMVLNFKADLYEMQAEHGKVMGAMKFAGMQFGRVMSGIMSAIGFIGIAVMLFQMGKQLIEMFKGVDERAKKIRENVEAQTESIKSLTEEIAKTAQFFEMDMFKTAEQRIKAIGGAFQSADFASKVGETRRAMNLLGENDEAVQAMLLSLEGLAFELGRFNPDFEEFRLQLIKNPKEALRNASALFAFSNAAVESGQAVDNITRAQANFNKQFNAFVQAGKKVPFQDIVLSLNELQKEQYKFAQSAGLSEAEQAKANAEYEITLQRLNAFKAVFEVASSRQLAFLNAQRAGLASMTALFGSKEDIQNSMKLATQVNKILEMRENLVGMELAVNEMDAGVTKEIREVQLNYAKQQFELEKDRLAMMMAEQDKMLKAFRDATTAFASELGTTFAKIFSGENIDAKKFGDSLAKSLTNALGKALANRIMQISYRGTPLDPDVQRQKFKAEVDAMLDTQGSKIESSVGEGGKDASINIFEAMDTGGIGAANTIYNQMVSAADYHANALYNAQTKIMVAQNILDNKILNDMQTELEELQPYLDEGFADFYFTDFKKRMFNITGGAEPRGVSTRAAGAYGLEQFDYSGPFGDIMEGEMIMTSARNYHSTEFVKMLKREFPDGIGDVVGSAFGFGRDQREGFAHHYGKVLKMAMRATRSGDLGGMMDAQEYFRENIGDVAGGDFLKMLRRIDDPQFQNSLSFLENLPEFIREFSKYEDEYANRVNIVEEATKREKELIEGIDTLGGKIDDNTIALEDRGVIVDESGNVTSSGVTFVPGDPDKPTTFTPEVRPMTFQEQTEKLFPNLFDALGKDSEGVAGFAKSTLHFSTVITQFGSLVAQGMALSGKQEEAADIMLEVAKIQMALAIAEMATKIGLSFGRYGGEKSFMYGGYTHGGVTDGPEAGYNVRMHGREAIVPLGNDRSIPVKMQGGVGTNNVNVTVNVDQSGASESFLTADGGAALGKTIAAIATDTIAKEQRAGGLLSRI